MLNTGPSIASMGQDRGLSESVAGRRVKLEHDRRPAVEQGRPDPRAVEAEITGSSELSVGGGV